MNLKILFQYGLMGLCLMGCSMNNAKAMDDLDNSDKILVVGCRPWDREIKEVPGLDRAHFVDFKADGETPVAPQTFHHIDVNDEGPYSQISAYYQGPLAGKLSEFTVSNPEKFKTIIIDWMTYQCIRQEVAWRNFSTLLSPGGTLIVPVTSINFVSRVSESSEKAKEIENKIAPLFSKMAIYQYETLPDIIELNLLRRQGIAEVAKSFTPAIIFATK